MPARGHRRMSKDSTPLSWRIKERPGFTTVEFTGEIDENADFSELRRQLRGAVVFRLSDVRRINSCGVREWVNFVRDLPNVNELVFSHCSPAIVTQLNMIYNFRGRASVRSFYAPYVCKACDHEEDKLLEVQTHFANANVGSGGPGRVRRPPEFNCEKCGGRMEFV